MTWKFLNYHIKITKLQKDIEQRKIFLIKIGYPKTDFALDSGLNYFYNELDKLIGEFIEWRTQYYRIDHGNTQFYE